tara:strand:+ start:9277 stop:15027 length:5751 start_codon:yes stop_codon:yes gene_type:complete
MPFSSSPVTVNPGDKVQVRYPTPSTWNTQVTVNVQIGTGSDPDGVTFGTKIPDATPQSFSFTDQSGFTGAFNGSSSSGSTTVFERNTTYYSQVIDIASIEIPIPASISAVSNGPKNSNTNNTTAQFRIYRNGAFDSWRTSISANINNGTGGLQPGDKVQLRVTVPDWYVTSTLVSFSVGDETFGTNIGQPSTSFTRTWGITTRAQDQNINQYAFTDRVDQKIPADGGNTYHAYNVPISVIDGDVVLRATSTGDVQISADNTNWTQSIGAQLIQGDTLYTRIVNGPGYTTKTTGTLNVFAVGGDTYSRGGNNFENTTGGTYGSGGYQVTQNLGTVTDNWQNWTEVDRYPDPVDAAPIFTYGVKLGLVGTAPAQQNPPLWIPGNTYVVSGGTGNSMVVKLTEGGFDYLEIDDPGYGYTIGDTVSITSGGEVVQLTVIEYEKVVVSSDNQHNRAEPAFMYFADVPITGLGTEYTTGIYNDLEAPYTNLNNNNPGAAQNLVSLVNGQGVKMTAIIDGTAGFIRKNNTGSWVQQLTIEENDLINLKLRSDINFDNTQIATVRLQGPPDGNPTIGNPTGGPANPTFAEKTFTMTLFTREARTIPYPFHATPVYLSDPGVEQIAEVSIRGLDGPTTAQITGGIGSLSVDGVNWGTSITVLETSQTLFVRQNADTGSGGLAEITYRLGTAADIANGDAIFDTFRVYTKQFNVIGDFITETWFGNGFVDYTEFTIPSFAGDEFFLALVGAGGGDGGGDIPNSSGGPGGAGNLVRLRVNIPVGTWPTNQFGQPDFKLRIYPGDSGADGDNYVVGSGGGAGGFGYAYGGDGGDSGPGDASGGGGGGGGASAITLTDGTLIAMAGGGGGGGGAGNDAATPLSLQYGNYNGYGSASTSTININLPGDDAPDRTGQGGGPGGGGGGYDGSAGTLINSYTEGGTVIQTSDLDSTGGNGGGTYYNPTYATPLSAASPSGQGAAPGEEGAVYVEYSQQDVTPNPFSFTTYDGASIQETVLSNIVQINGITGTVPVTVSAPGFTADVRVCSGPTANTCGPYQSSAQIGNNQFLQIRATTGNQFFTTFTVAVTVGDTTSNWDINTGAPPDTEPNVYTISDVSGAPIDTEITSEEINISGITVPVSVTATNGAEVSVEGAAFVNGATGATIENGEQFRVRVDSSVDYQDSVTTQVTVGNGTPVDWTVTTAAELDSQPDSYTWIDEIGAGLEETFESNTNLIQGLETTANFIVEQGSGDQGPNTDLARIIKNGTLLGEGVTTTTVQNFDTLALYYTTSNVVGESRVFNTKLGLATATTGFYETEWNVVTAGQFGTTPTAFAFAPVIAAGNEVYAEAAETVTIGGLSNGVAVGLYGTNGVQFNINNGGWNVYTVNSQANVSNGDTFRVRLLSSGIPGFTRTAFVFAGSFNTGFSVQSPAGAQDPIVSQWYSSITPCKYIGNSFSGDQIRINTKFDGLPVGAIMPVFQDGTESDFWGTLDGKANSRFPSWVYCDGGYYDPAEYPLLYSVLGYEYGAKVVGSDTYFRVPDLRNRYVKGTGVIDGNSASSPGLNPSFQPSKQSGSPGNAEPGAFGGMWFVDTVGDPGVDELEQVVQPATGQPAQDSEYFGIAQVSTAGYNEVGGLIEFFTSGKATCPVGLDPEKIYEVPLHFHDLISGVPDPGSFKGRVTWGGSGGFSRDVTAPNAQNIGSPSVGTFESSGTISFNLWGYALEDYDLTASNLPGSTGCNGSGWWDGSTGNWGSGTNPGYEGIDEVGEYGSVTIQQSGIGSTEYSEINSYIDLDAQPFTGQTGAFGGTNARKFLTTVDIPRKTITVKSYNPTNKLKHNHYVSLTAITGDNVYGYGNNETGGTASTNLNSFSGGINSSVDLEFSALDIGIQVLPGTFTLQQTKQLIPVPEFSPQDQVPMVTPYVWSKWMIKAY